MYFCRYYIQFAGVMSNGHRKHIDHNYRKCLRIYCYLPKSNTELAFAFLLFFFFTTFYAIQFAGFRIVWFAYLYFFSHKFCPNCFKNIFRHIFNVFLLSHAGYFICHKMNYIRIIRSDVDKMHK